MRLVDCNRARKVATTKFTKRFTLWYKAHEHSRSPSLEQRISRLTTDQDEICKAFLLAGLVLIASPMRVAVAHAHDADTKRPPEFGRVTREAI